ncbi:MAG: SGNH/GDSL hydrolase family protein [Armatimonadota bacterium]
MGTYWTAALPIFCALSLASCRTEARDALVGEGLLPVERVAAAGKSGLRPIMPPEIFAVPGLEANLYFDNIILSPDSGSLLWDVDCALGRQQSERWTAVPTPEQVGDFPLTVRIVTPEVQPVLEMTTTVHVIDPAAGADREVTLLCVGDSLTAASAYTARLLELCAAEGNPALTLIGENGPGGASGNRHEGYGGWACRTFVENWGEGQDFIEQDGRRRRARSPFLFEVDGTPRLDFQRYLDRNNDGQPPDFITILLGCNDTFSADEASIEERIDAMFAYLDRLLAAFRAAAPEAEIGLLLVPPAASQDAFAANYGTTQTRWQYRRNQHRVVEREYETYGGREAEGLFLVPAFVNLDTVHGFPRVTAPANAHSDVEISRMSNGVHPAAAGYDQIGDAIYCWIKSRLAAR